MRDVATFTLLKLFPHDDADFTSFAEATLCALGERAGPGELERLLRERYPRVRVRVQERLAMNGEVRPHWYVFRYGAVRVGGDPRGGVEGRGSPELLESRRRT